MFSEVILEKNLKALTLVNEKLVEPIRNAKKIDWIDIIHSKNRMPNMLMKIEGKISSVYDYDNPKKEAMEVAKINETKKEDATIIIGAGLGYILKSILQTKEKKSRVILIEPNYYMLKLCLSKNDLYKNFMEGELLIVDGRDRNEVSYVVNQVDGSAMIENWHLLIERYARIRVLDYGEIITHVADLINQLRCNVGTVSANGAKIADNDIVNLPYLLKNRGVIELAGLYKSMPAICVNTGPSLQQHIHLLKNIQDKVIIIAVAQALRPLLAYEVTPDFICTVDYGEPNIGHFQGLMDCKIPLICLNRTYAPILKQYKGPKFIVATPTPGFEETAAGLLKDKGYMEQGGSVAHLALGIAFHLGCDPITMIGLDLSYGDSKTSHNKQADAQGKIEIDENGLIQWVIEDPRSVIYNKKSCMGKACYVPGYYGKQVVTNLGLQSFITSFEIILRRRKEFGDIRTIYNSTEGGCHIPGSERIPFKEFIKKNCTKPLIKDAINDFIPLSEDSDDNIKNAIQVLKKDITNLNKIIMYSTKALKVNGKIAKHRELKEDELRKLLKRNETLSNKANEFSEKNCLVMVAIYGASRTIHTRRLEVGGKVDHILSNEDDFDIRLDRNKLILTAALNAAKELRVSYKKSLKILEKYNKTRNRSLLESTELDKIDFDDVDAYFNAGNFAHPLLDAEKTLKEIKKIGIIDDEIKKLKEQALTIKERALRMKRKAIKEGKKLLSTKSHDLILYNDYIEQSKVEGRDNKNFDKSIEYIQKAIDLFPEREEARWGLASAYYYLKKYDKALECYDELVKLNPINYRYRFEYCNTLLQMHKTVEALKKLGELMNLTKEYDYFLAKVGDLYQEVGVYDEANKAYEEYLHLFPIDYEIMEKYANCLDKLFDKTRDKKLCKKAIKLRNKAYKIKGDFE